MASAKPSVLRTLVNLPPSRNPPHRGGLRPRCRARGGFWLSVCYHQGSCLTLLAAYRCPCSPLSFSILRFGDGKTKRTKNLQITSAKGNAGRGRRQGVRQGLQGRRTGTRHWSDGAAVVVLWSLSSLIFLQNTVPTTLVICREFV